MINQSLYGKRLLVLGGSLWKDAIKQFADENGITVIAAGNNTSAGIFEIADEQYQVDSTDSESMKKLILEKSIDGVYMGGAEGVIGAACEYLEELGLPCYCNKKQWRSLQNKECFKELCRKSGLPVVPEYYSGRIEADPQDLPYPVVVKPIDGCGSSGFSVCNNSQDLVTAIATAEDNSPSKQVIIEKFVNNEGHVVFYTIHNGKVLFSGMSDKYPVKYEKQGSYVGGLFVYESSCESEFRSLYEENIQKLIDSLGIETGTFWIEIFHDQSEYYFNEAGFRYGGSGSIYTVDYLYGINQVAMDIHYALTGECKISDFPALIDTGDSKKEHYAVYPVHLNPGVIRSIEGLDQIEADPRVVKVLVAKHVGETIEDTGSFSQAFALVHIAYNQVSELKETIKSINENLFVGGLQNENMLHVMLDVEKLREVGAH